MSSSRSRALAAVSRREDFAALGASRSRGRSGSVRVVFAPPDESSGGPSSVVPQVAYGISRAVGTAVVRNRTRRRLRAVMRDCQAEGLLGPGRFLVSVSPGVVDLGFDDLQAHVRAALADLP